MDATKDHERLLRKFPPELADYEAVFTRLRDNEKRKHRSVKLIHELTGKEPSDHQDLLAFLGFPDAEALCWDTVERPRDPVEAVIAMGGHVRAAKIPGEPRIATFVLLKPIVEVPKRIERCLLIPILLHEMGHVDDLEKERNLRFDGVVDVADAETYAHIYACRRMMRENLRLPLGNWLGTLLSDAKDKAEGSPAQVAASRIISSGEYKQFRQFVGDLIDVEG